MTVNCACGDDECRTAIHLSGYGRELWFTSHCGSEHLMYLDANAIVKLIGELRYALDEMMDRVGKEDS